ncbi:ammonium transporter [Luteimicrobium subarcticum]|uniref:Ammonium transporter n=1 Tax=Luteimicrobium subarcticum TaxID=620910 RepID=A0A2M8WU58_9MICO|nr:ammonium transporter [Luteimicrobium subarcticum]PJI94444.1 ammonium transporter [Luteimicrobium subarcticum]
MAADAFTLDSGNTAWMMTSAVIVLMMTVPGLAFFYGGMVRTKSVLNMMVMNFVAVGVVGLIWILYGYSMAFGTSTTGFGQFVSSPFTYFGLVGLTDDKGLYPSAGVPALVYVAFQATFAVITVALITGAIADRMKFGSWIAFSAVWVTAVYFPLAHMVWGGGFLSPVGKVSEWLSTPIDFAGGTVVHIDAGAAGFALCLLLGRRKGWMKEPMRPHNLPFVMLGAALLWIGWFGFNAGSELAADGVAGRAWINTFVATCVAMLAWMATEKVRDGKATSLGAASGVVAGLVAITPAAAAVDSYGAIAIGLVAGILCALAVGLKFRFGFDDALDVVGVHLVGGIVGCVMLGLVATHHQGAWYPDGAQDGLLYGGGATQLLTQILTAAIAVVFSFVLTYVIGLVIKAITGLRVDEADEVGGVDLALHGETAYESVPGTGRVIKEVNA